jgi:hypothetical protein
MRKQPANLKRRKRRRTPGLLNLAQLRLKKAG